MGFGCNGLNGQRCRISGRQRHPHSDRQRELRDHYYSGQPRPGAFDLHAVRPGARADGVGQKTARGNGTLRG